MLISSIAQLLVDNVVQLLMARKPDYVVNPLKQRIVLEVCGLVGAMWGDEHIWQVP